MDQIKIGAFIAAKRKEKKLTQRQLADHLNLSDKTISKWECGKGLPEVSYMIPLCNILGISVNELLSGEHLTSENYLEKAEENMMNLVKEKEESKKKIILSLLVCFICILGAVPLILVAGTVEITTIMRIGLIIIAAILIVTGIAVACVLDRDAGAFECPSCHTRFTPTMKSYIMGPHTLTTRQLKCPNCGEVHYCRHRLTR